MSHDEIRGLAAGYALSALDSVDLKDFEAHLASCPECRTGLAELRPLIDALSMTAEEQEPEQGLRPRILASARAETQAPVQPAKPAPWWRRPVLWPLPVAAVVTALAVAVAVVSVWGSQASDGSASIQPLLDLPYDEFDIVLPADDRLSSVERQLRLSYEGIEIMAQAGQWWRFDGSGINLGAAGTLAYSAEFGASCLLVLGLAEGDEAMYQARVTEADGRVRLRRMWRFNNAMWLVLEGDPNELRGLEIIRAGSGSLPASETPALVDVPLTSS